MNPTVLLYNSDRFEDSYSGRGCDRKPVRYLKIKYIKKIGNFCQICADDLLESGLVEEIKSNSDSLEEAL
ncbi:hypothetical protein BH18THE2_BH18THE2_25560 [soil metagenome]